MNQEEIRSIVDLQIGSLVKRIESLGWSLTVTQAAREAIAVEGFDPQYGARPLKRVVQQRIENPLASKLLKANESSTAKELTVGYDGETFSIDTA